VRISLAASGLFDPRQLNAWSTERRKAIHKAVARGMRSGGREVRDVARVQMRTAFQVKRSSFVSSLRAKLLDKSA
jgi:hypothetical protein